VRAWLHGSLRPRFRHAGRPSRSDQERIRNQPSHLLKAAPLHLTNALSPDLEAPPPITVRFFEESVDLDAWTYCFGNGCVDGSPPLKPHDVGGPEEVGVAFPLPGWSFKASFSPAGKQCGRIQTVPLQPAGDGRFVLRPAGFAGTYDVTLSGRGDGDLFTTFRWTTPFDGPLPAPRARLAVLAGLDGEVDSYGVELALTNLAQTPREAAAVITVEADGGETLSFNAKLSRGCHPEGTAYWDGPDDQGRAAASLGEGPFEYEVVLVLDGKRYVAQATWPDDEIKGNEPSVRLDFTPDLPGLS
jgi:hypothetical protein